jgi:hypothetical protein
MNHFIGFAAHWVCGSKKNIPAFVIIFTAPYRHLLTQYPYNIYFLFKQNAQEETRNSEVYWYVHTFRLRIYCFKHS